LTLKLTHVVAVVDTAESTSAENIENFFAFSVFTHALTQCHDKPYGPVTSMKFMSRRSPWLRMLLIGVKFAGVQAS
jgi:hypothetical protein